MLHIADHIYDIAENSIRAGAKLIEICITENDEKNLLSVKIIDDGTGMSAEEIQKVFDPFYTTKEVRRIGLGIPLLSEAAQRAGGTLHISSTKGKGTTLVATFKLDHIDRQPMGPLTLTLTNLIVGNSFVDFIYKYVHNDRQFELDTREIRKEIGDLPINHPEIVKYIRKVIEDGLNEIQPKA